MKQVRIRSISNGETSPWIYIQEKIQKETPKTPVVKIQATSSTGKRSRVNQYGRFRYSEMQYGEIQRILSSLEVNNTPIRIRNQDGDWIYFQQTTIEGACPAIRIRSKNAQEAGPWVYIQQKEV